ncbi:MAG: ABC transporter permease subunit [Chthoniobacter sp.]|uniref:ABC transporter permease n=1 Tax=Chthoniobacter sp. TaxID=2510640 RepID=UPI0032A5FB6F
MTATPTATKHKAFSLSRVSAIASNTLLELVRLKVFYFMLLFALLIIGSSFFTSKFTFQEQFQVLKDVSLGAMSIFTWLLAVLATAMLLPKDIEDRTLYTILAKPVPRFEYLLGKFIGVLALLFIAISLMSAVFMVVLYTREQDALANAARYVPDNALPDQLNSIRAASFNSNLLPGIVIIYLKSALCAALTLLLSTFASSWIFTVIMSVVVYLIGHIQPIARQAYLDSATTSHLTKVFLALVALIIPDLTSLSLVDDIVVGNAIPMLLFVKTAGLGVTYIGVYFLVGYFVFSGKEL